MARTRRRRLIVFILGCAILPIQCRTPDGSSDAKFGWDDDLDPLKKDGDAAGLDRPVETRIDRSFCRGATLGQCFTFVTRVPTSDLVADLGLNALALAARSQKLSKVMEDACQAAWLSYRDRYRSAPLNPLRKAFVNRVTKMRCVFVPMSDEYVVESLPLADNELGLSARLTSFEITGRNDSATVGFLKLSRDETIVESGFRSVALFPGKSLSGSKPTWQLSSAFNVAPVKVRESFGLGVSWKVDVASAISVLSKIDTTQIKDQTDQAIKSFVDKAKPALAAFSAKNISLGSSVLLLGLGYEALKSLCGEDSARCKVERSEANKTPVFDSNVKDFVPSSEMNEVLRTSVIKNMHAMWDRIFEGVDKKQMIDAFKL